MKKRILIFALALVLVVALAACGRGGNNNAPQSNGSPTSPSSSPDSMSGTPSALPSSGQLDGRLVLPDGQAWMEDGEMPAGYIFMADGTFEFYWGEEWELPETGTWTTDGGILTITDDYGIREYTYEISGGTLTITDRFNTSETVTYTQQPIPSSAG